MATQAILVNLERAGLIARSPHPLHGRVIMTELTEAGRTTVDAGLIAADAVERQMLSGLSKEEARVLNDLLERCAAALQTETPNR